MTRKHQLILVLVVFILAAGWSAYSASNSIQSHRSQPPSYPFEDARVLAQAQLPAFFNLIAHTPTDFGFANDAEISRATLGQPYIPYAFDLWNLPTELNDGVRFRQQLNGGTSIEFPILVDGDPRSNISVIYRNSTWSAAERWGGGSSPFAMFQKQLAARGITDRVDMLIFGPSWSVFGLLDYQGETVIIPIQDDGHHFPTLDTSGERMYRLEEIMPLIRREARRVTCSMGTICWPWEAR